ncbi:hypothetical protein [Modicisalibacter tunisiensis]|uniref:Secreted protein n=1 Tax=Modicisalibacter tunisiensis TaxID=390637 RepID=A0ABS7WYZ5_9GAMM|nr:hypothetical protein [Modicisalibacter tunisiensis]KXS36993.1 MAG: hypothetical protein AWU55_2735 [Halomonadaceae bacterium T82-2]MBZ9567858.1 hypothetical protein [Modicisalibacter tunisiensis]
MKRINPISLASVLLVSTLAASGAVMAGETSTIAPDSGLDVGHQVPPQHPVQATHNSGINLGDGSEVVTDVSDLAPGAGIEAVQARIGQGHHAVMRTAYQVKPLVSDGGV